MWDTLCKLSILVSEVFKTFLDNQSLIETDFDNPVFLFIVLESLLINL